jgi:hypothetical protein
MSCLSYDRKDDISPKATVRTQQHRLSLALANTQLNDRSGLSVKLQHATMA